MEIGRRWRKNVPGYGQAGPTADTAVRAPRKSVRARSLARARVAPPAGRPARAVPPRLLGPRALRPGDVRRPEGPAEPLVRGGTRRVPPRPRGARPRELGRDRARLRPHAHEPAGVLAREQVVRGPGQARAARRERGVREPPPRSAAPGVPRGTGRRRVRPVVTHDPHPPPARRPRARRRRRRVRRPRRERLLRHRARHPAVLPVPHVQEPHAEAPVPRPPRGPGPPKPQNGSRVRRRRDDSNRRRRRRQ